MNFDTTAIRARCWDLRWLAPDNPPTHTITLTPDDLATLRLLIGTDIPALLATLETLRHDRPPLADITDHNDLQGPRHGHHTIRPGEQHGWSVFATDHIVFSGTGHISYDEARRMSAALTALANAHQPQAATHG
jgi:hypothetical protein